jgi:hypothetical protein
MCPANLEWGYAARGNSFIRRVRTVLIATAVGASFGCIVVLSFFAPSIETGTLTQQGQSGQAASTPTPQLNRKPGGNRVDQDLNAGPAGQVNFRRTANGNRSKAGRASGCRLRNGGPAGGNKRNRKAPHRE